MKNLLPVSLIPALLAVCATKQAAVFFDTFNQVFVPNLAEYEHYIFEIVDHCMFQLPPPSPPSNILRVDSFDLGFCFLSVLLFSSFHSVCSNKLELLFTPCARPCL